MTWFVQILADAASADSVTFLDYISKAGVVVMLLLILYGGYKKWWVWGYQLRECQAREEEYKLIAMKSVHTAESAASAGEHLVERNRALREGDTS